MTTESNDRPRDAGLRILGGVMLVALGAAVVVTAAGALLGGSPGAAGAAAGAFSVALVMGFGTYVVHVVAMAVPGLSLMMALMTYVLQIVMIGAFFLVLVRSGAMGDSVDGPWLVAGVVVASLTWSAAQIWLSSRARIPMYDLASTTTSHRQEAGEG